MRARYLTCRFIALSIALTCLALPGRSLAADDQIGDLRREVAALRQTVHQLEERINDLEARSCTPAADRSEIGEKSEAEPAEPTARKPRTDQAATRDTINRQSTVSNNALPSLRDRWRSLDLRMSADQVEGLLGTPQEKFTAAEKIVWYYRYANHQGGSVTFFRDMRVAGWQAPPASGY